MTTDAITAHVMTVARRLENVEAEIALIGGLLNASPHKRRQVLAELKPEHFSEPLLGDMLETIARQVDSTASAVVILRPFLQDDDGRKVVARCAASASPQSALMDYAREVIDLWQRRQLIDSSVATLRAVDDLQTGTDTLLATLSADIAQIRAYGATVETSTAADAAEAVLAHIEAIRDGTSAGRYVKTGLSSFDRAFGGLERGESVILAGRPGMGKTSVALWLAMKQAQQGRGVLIFSLEMSRDALAARLMSCMVREANATYSTQWIAYHDIMHGKVARNDDAMQRLNEAAMAMASLPITIDDRGLLDMQTIEAVAARWRAKCIDAGIDPVMVVFDHIGLMRGDRWKSPYEVVSEHSRRLKVMAKDMNVVGLVVSQLNRSVESRGDKRPTLADLRESGALEQDAAQVIFPYRGAYYLEREAGDDPVKLAEAESRKHVIEMIMAKNRNGMTGMVPVFIDMAHCYMADLETTHDDVL